MRPIDLVGRVLERRGALVEEAGDGLIDALLPEVLQRELSLPEAASLSEDGSHGVAAGYGSETLGKLARAVIGETGRIAGAWLAMEPRSMRVPDPCYTGLNVSLTAARQGPGAATILDGLFKAVVDADEQRQIAVRAAVALPSGAPLPRPVLPRESLGPRSMAPDREGLLRGLDALGRAAERAAREAAEPLRAAAAARLSRDRERLSRYFQDLEQDIHARIARGKAPGMEAKLQAIEADRKRRHEQLLHTYRARLTIEPVALWLVEAPSERALLTLRRRDRKRELQVAWIAPCKTWEPLLCDGCGLGALAVALCEDARHVLCTACYDSCGTGGRRPCFRCAGTQRPENPRLRPA